MAQFGRALHLAEDVAGSNPAYSIIRVFFVILIKIYNERDVNLLVKISKSEMEYLQKSGVKFGENGLSHTTARHRRTYYLTESVKNMALLNTYREASVCKANM